MKAHQTTKTLSVVFLNERLYQFGLTKLFRSVPIIKVEKEKLFGQVEECDDYDLPTYLGISFKKLRRGVQAKLSQAVWPDGQIICYYPDICHKWQIYQMA